MQILVLKSEVAVIVCIYMERPPPPPIKIKAEKNRFEK